MARSLQGYVMRVKEIVKMMTSAQVFNELFNLTLFQVKNIHDKGMFNNSLIFFIFNDGRAILETLDSVID